MTPAPNMPRPQVMRDILDLLQRSATFVLSGHENPDGDCLGAQVALYHLLVGLGKTVRVVNPDGGPASLAFLTGHTPIESWDGREAPAAEVVVLLDCAQLSRLGGLGEAWRQAPPSTLAVIDHHVGSEEGDGAVSYVDSSAPSTGAMVMRLFRELGRPLGRDAAEGVFVSLVSDTGWFRYSNTTAEVFRCAAELVEVGVEPAVLYDRLFRQNDPDSIPLLAAGLTAAERSADGRYVYAVQDNAAVMRAARAGFDTDLVLDPLRSVRGTEVVGIFKELSGSRVKLSLRAVGDVDVQAIAAEFGGGGHRKAAGAQLNCSLAQAVARVRERVEAALAALG